MLPRIELVRRGECVTLCLNLWLPEQTGSDAFEAELQAAAAALDALRPEAPLPPLTRHAWLREDCPSQPQWQALVEQVTAPDFQAHTPKVVLSRQSRLTHDGATRTADPQAVAPGRCWPAGHSTVRTAFTSASSFRPSRASSPAPRAALSP